MAHKIDSASGSITLISEDGSGNVNLTLPRAGLGTAASADTGTAAGNIPVLDGSGQIASGVLTNAAVADNAITLAKMAHGTDGELITYDATGAPANVAVGTSGQVLTSGGAGVAPTFQTAAGGGKVLQVVSTTKTDTFTTSSASWTDLTGLTVSITPSSTSSEILVSYDIGMSNTNSTYRAYARLVRGSTGIAVGDSAGSRQQCTSMMRPAANNAYAQSSITYLDSPATTSATTYKVQIGSFNGNTVTVNRDGDDTDFSEGARMASSITVMEIGA